MYDEVKFIYCFIFDGGFWEISCTDELVLENYKDQVI